jgi:hypothetical protein
VGVAAGFVGVAQANRIWTACGQLFTNGTQAQGAAGSGITTSTNVIPTHGNFFLTRLGFSNMPSLKFTVVNQGTFRRNYLVDLSYFVPNRNILNATIAGFYFDPEFTRVANINNFMMPGQNVRIHIRWTTI